MKFIRGQGVFYVEPYTDSSCCTVQKLYYRITEYSRTLLFVSGIRGDEDYADLNNCSSFGITSGKCKGAEVLLKISGPESNGSYCNLKQTLCTAIRYKYISIQIGWGRSEEIFNF